MGLEAEVVVDVVEVIQGQDMGPLQQDDLEVEIDEAAELDHQDLYLDLGQDKGASAQPDEETVHEEGEEFVEAHDLDLFVDRMDSVGVEED